MWRTLDVGAVVESLATGQAVVVAGRHGLARTVTSAHAADTVQDLRRATAGELVVTTTDVLSTEQPLDGALERLHASGVAAIAFPCTGSHTVPPDVVAVADRLSLPILAFSATETLAEVTSAVLAALVTAQRRRLDRFAGIHQQFTAVMLAGGGVTEIARVLHSLLGRRFVIVDAAGRSIATMPDGDQVDARRRSPDVMRQPIDAGDHRYGEIVVEPGADELGDEQLLSLERAATAIALRLSHASAIAAQQERFAATSLEQLIAGPSDGATELVERAAGFGWDLALPRAVLLASIDPPADATKLPNALSTIAAAARATLGRDAIVWSRSTMVAALLAPPTAAAAERRRTAEALREELDVRLRGVTVSIGVGRRVDRPGELWRSHVEASRAVDVGRWAKGRNVTQLFDELGIERLLASTPEEDLAGFVRQAIGSLIDHDVAQRGELVDTLAVWLETRNMAAAARRLHVHYNTFKNRLERIESIVGPVATDATLALECEIAIHILRHYDGPWKDDELRSDDGTPAGSDG